MANALLYKVETFDGSVYTLLINPVNWKLTDYENYATAYAQANNVIVTIYKALEDWNPDGSTTSYSQS